MDISLLKDLTASGAVIIVVALFLRAIEKWRIEWSSIMADVTERQITALHQIVQELNETSKQLRETSEVLCKALQSITKAGVDDASHSS